MPFTQYGTENLAQWQLQAGISAAATSIILQSGQWGLFPANAECPFWAKIEQYDTAINNYRVLKREIVKITGRTGDTLTATGWRAAWFCPVDYAATTQTQTALSFSAGDTITQIFSSEQIVEIQTAIAGKVDTAWGLRTGFWTNKHVRVNQSTWAEEIKNITTGVTILAADNLLVEKASGDYEKFNWSILKTDASNANAEIITAPAGESITSTDAITLERLSGFYQTSPLAYQAMGNTAANNRVSQTIMGNGVGFTTLNLVLVKSGAPTDTTTFTIETDNAGSPSGTAVTNGTQTLVGTEMSTSWTDTTITFPGTVTLTAGVRYHLVWKRQNAFDGVNFYNIGTLSFNTRFSTRNLYNASWGTPTTTTGVFMMKCNGIFSNIAVKATAAFQSLANVDGFAQAAYTLGQTVSIYRGLCTLSGLTKDGIYSLSDTAGVISLTPWTIKTEVGMAITTSTISFLPSYKNMLEEYALVRLYSANTAGLTRRFQFTDNGTFIFSYGHNSSTGALYLIFKNGVSQVNIAPWGNSSNTYNISFAPGDVITFYAVRTEGAWMTITLSRTLPLFNMIDLW